MLCRASPIRRVVSSVWARKVGRRTYLPSLTAVSSVSSPRAKSLTRVVVQPSGDERGSISRPRTSKTSAVRRSPGCGMSAWPRRSAGPRSASAQLCARTCMARARAVRTNASCAAAPAGGWSGMSGPSIACVCPARLPRAHALRSGSGGSRRNSWAAVRAALSTPRASRSKCSGDAMDHGCSPGRSSASTRLPLASPSDSTSGKAGNRRMPCLMPLFQTQDRARQRREEARQLTDLGQSPLRSAGPPLNLQ